jgi:predicted DNA-binding transcriptional regulator AlpA
MAAGAFVRLEVLMQDVISEKQAAEITGLKVSTLRKHRHFGTGIPYIKLGRTVRYLRSDISRHLESCRVEPGKANGR